MTATVTETVETLERVETAAAGTGDAPERRYVEAGYRNLPFPLAEEPAPAFTLATEWDLEQALGYFGSWSAVQRYRDSTGRDPLPELCRALEPHWAGRLRRLEWPLHLRVGRV